MYVYIARLAVEEITAVAILTRIHLTLFSVCCMLMLLWLQMWPCKMRTAIPQHSMQLACSAVLVYTLPLLT